MSRSPKARNSRPGEKPRWLDDPGNINRMVYALYAVSALLLVIDPFIHKHGPFAIEHWWGFYGVYGFVCCVFLVLAAKEILRKLVMRGEDYYDD
jgi:hypothetical protein